MKKEHKLNSFDIVKLFGRKSNFYTDIIQDIKSKYDRKQLKIKRANHEWKETFEKIYGKNISPEIYIKQLYYTHFLYAFLIIKLQEDLTPNFKLLYDKYKKGDSYSEYFEELHFFKWYVFSEETFLKIYKKIRRLELRKQDLFHELYQEIIFSKTRHQMGEFYTPPILVQKMVEKSYEFGLKVLDPSCGSGVFLLEIIHKIIEENQAKRLKIAAISKIYGFDKNPLAIVSTKTNILLLLSTFTNIEVIEGENLPKIFLGDSLFPEKKISKIPFNSFYHYFDLIIGNPPWITYKDIKEKDYQIDIKKLSQDLDIKPSSQYITHIELAALFFYASAQNFSKKSGKIHFVMPKSILNGDHCERFRKFSCFSNLEIWDFPENYFFNVPHICLKAEYTPNILNLNNNFPIPAKIFDKNLNLQRETEYSTYEINQNGAKKILPIKELSKLVEVGESKYKDKFYQGATLVPRSLVFFQNKKDLNDFITIESDPDILSRAKKKWKIKIKTHQVESVFNFYSFLNKDLVPFYLKQERFVFLPIKKDTFAFDQEYLGDYPKAVRFYKILNKIYKEKRKSTSKIMNLIDNLNYWNKLEKQSSNVKWIVTYNASGSNLKAAVINNENKNLIIGSENYYYSTLSEYEAYYLCGILNSLILSKHVKLIKSSRHIHKRPFSFPIPLYNKNNDNHRTIALKARKYHTLVSEIVNKNPEVTSRKIRMLISHKLKKLDNLVEKIIF